LDTLCQWRGFGGEKIITYCCWLLNATHQFRLIGSGGALEIGMFKSRSMTKWPCAQALLGKHWQQPKR